MAHPKTLREAVKRAYVFERQPLEVAALACGVAIGTARRWKSEARDEGDDWDKLQAAQTLASGSIEDLGRQMLAGFLLQYQAAMDALSDPQGEPLNAAARVQMLASLADSYNKTIAANKRILPETSQLATALEVVSALAQFVQQQYPQHAAALVDVLEPFGQTLAARYG